MEYKIEGMDEKSIELPIFGKITLRESDWEYQYQYDLAEYDFNGSPVDLDVNFMELTDDHIEKVSQALTDLKRLNGMGMKGFKQDFEDGGETRSYIEEWSDILRHLFTEEEFETYIRDTDNQKSIEERLLSRLRLVRAGIYAGSQNYFMIMDYAFGYDIEKGFRDDMLVVKLDRDYNIVDISMKDNADETMGENPLFDTGTCTFPDFIYFPVSVPCSNKVFTGCQSSKRSRPDSSATSLMHTRGRKRTPHGSVEFAITCVRASPFHLPLAWLGPVSGTDGRSVLSTGITCGRSHF